ALPAGDHPLRVALLGRLAVAELGRGELWDSSRRHAQDAIEMAKRLDDPDLVATALIDRHLVAMHDTDLVARAAAADELIELGEAARRPDRVLIGLQWRYGAAISRGDLGGAKAVLDDSDVLAALMPSPEWTYSVMLRRVMICAIEGDRHTALRLTEASRLLGDRVLWPDEALGLEVGLRTLICRITGVADPALPALNEEFETSAKLPANNFFLVHSAAAAQAVGDVDTARRLVERVAASICRVGAPPEQPSTILLTGELVARLGLHRYAPALKAMGEPFRGYLTTESGFAVDQPTDTTLAQLALAAGDALEALQLIERSLDFVRAMPSPSYEARCLWHRSRIHRQLGDQRQADRDLRQARMIAERIGAELPGDDTALPAAAAGRAALSRQGSTWLVHSPHGNGVVAHSTGIDQLARLLAAAPAEVLAVDLSGAGVDGAPISASLGPALDTTAKHAYRRRIADLQEEIDEAERFHDPERATRAQIELDLLMRELRQAVGLHGRDRPVGSSAERARINVARSVRRAISAVRSAVPGLGAHLEASIRTGRACCYAPDPGARLDWEIQRN
ncbi:MAG TPA: tetratricopeptide repeat protein, partial [Ilumatobacteraceae bacterium]|nr:tetratricopeptide repeat protein [Ilumatobacteraceae bacterium]